MAYVRQRQCIICNNKETVRKDNKSEICGKCSRLKSLEKANQVLKDKTEYVSCKCCGKRIKKSLGYTHCSIECRRKQVKTVNRKCKKCGKGFTVLKSSLSEKTNSSGNFCSIDCYHNFLCNTERATGRGSRWNLSRKISLEKTPFCAICGTSKNLQVHHIVPFRLTNNNSQENLIPLCVKHHKMVEMQFVNTENEGIDLETQSLVWRSILMEYRNSTLMKLKEIYDEFTSKDVKNATA